MAAQDDVKGWFAKCFNANEYSAFVEGHKCKNYNKKRDNNPKTNRLQIHGRYAYCPDIVLEDKQNHKIKYIIEVEGGESSAPGLKGISGAILLADYGVAKQQCEKFNMLFIVCTNDDVGKLQARINVAENYCWKNLDKVKVCDFESFKNNPDEKLNELFS